MSISGFCSERVDLTRRRGSRDQFDPGAAPRMSTVSGRGVERSLGRSMKPRKSPITTGWVFQCDLHGEKTPKGVYWKLILRGPQNRENIAFLGALFFREEGSVPHVHGS